MTQMGALKPKKTPHCLTVLEVRKAKSKVLAESGFSESSEGEYSMLLPSCKGQTATPGVPWLVAASLFSLPPSSRGHPSLCASLPLSRGFLIRTPAM